MPDKSHPPVAIYCLVPRGTDPATLARLEHELGGAPHPIVVERRTRTRRSDGDRRAAAASSVNGSCRRRIRNGDGRRIADRRGVACPWAAGLLLARRLRRICEPVELIQVAPSEDPAIAETLRLVVRFQAGETAAFRELYERFFPKIYRYLRSALVDRHAAEDQSQEVFVRVFRALSSYEVRGVPFEAWLFRIARNQAIDERRRRDALVVEEPARVGSRQEALAAGPARAFGQSSDEGLLHLVHRLPLAQRQVVVLRYVVDLDWKTIALTLDKSPGAVRQLEQRAFSSLRRRLEASGRAPGVQRLPLVRRASTSPVTARRRGALAA